MGSGVQRAGDRGQRAKLGDTFVIRFRLSFAPRPWFCGASWPLRILCCIQADGGKQSLDDAAFAALESEFQGIMQQMETEPSLEAFRVEYEKLHAALRKSHTSEKRLMAKCRELNAELVASAAKVRTTAI